MNCVDLPIADAGARLRDGSLSSVELTEAHFDRVRSRDGVYHAFVALARDHAVAEAQAADRELAAGIDRGPMHGIPVGVKDLIDVAGLPAACGSAVFDNRVAAEDAEVVRRLRVAGAIIAGKLATYEFALVGPSFDTPFPPVANPWNVARITGGSSSGCAAAVAGGLLRTSIGTDTGGSVRSPACYCGVVGLKPTFGLVPRDGVFPLSGNLDHVGPLSASVAEAAMTLDAIADPDPTHAAASTRLGRPPEGLRIAYARSWFAHDLQAEPAVVTAVDDAASRLSLLGARIGEVDLPDYAIFEACGSIILHAEALAIHKDLMRDKAEAYGRLAYRSLASGPGLDGDDLAQALRAATHLKRSLDEQVFSQFDALLTVNALTTAPPFSAFDGETAAWTPMRTIPFNVTGHPALAVPAGFAGGLPVGIQIVGKAFDEAMICGIGDAFEKATDFAAVTPPAIRP